MPSERTFLLLLSTLDIVPITPYTNCWKQNEWGSDTYLTSWAKVPLAEVRVCVFYSKGSGSNLAERHTPGLLSCRQKRHFWLTWQAGTLALGSGLDHGFNTIISYDDFDIFQVTSISLSTYNTTGFWEIPLEDG